jgi:hypothetical protein
VALEGEAGRLKQTRLAPAKAAKGSRVARLPLDGRSWNSVLEDARKRLADAGHAGSLAVLCRTNAEAASAYLALRTAWPDLSVQSSANSRAGRLRHLGIFLDTLKRETLESGNRPLDETLRDKILGEYRSARYSGDKRRDSESDLSRPALGTVQIHALLSLSDESHRSDRGVGFG